MREIDARGKPCPQPVLMVKEVVDAGVDSFAVLVDSQASVENVRRFAERSGFSVTVEEKEGFFRLVGRKEGAPAEEEKAEKAAEIAPAPVKTLLILSDTLGRDDPVLGRKLVKILLDTLAVQEKQPQYIILMNAGVKLACEGSEVLEALADLEAKGVQILACGTCLNHFNLLPSLRVGRPTNAYEVTNLLLAGGVLTWG
ncbi:selenium metabolism protein YedF [Ammonifex degensii KC4]|uniref:Selenium metabolism protein YedF n=1 Tax=Ammonifex degensii (strain DSM 10501 / KC4) TaxID=429009 RepID=C9RC01_AMMDK|nr:sulfurtransferase-like selenium metabolism protein YedF [Ammonifex degensii]ACX51778.1 selenium metabolism protein YedF [Ammonifex degensii KC4]